MKNNDKILQKKIFSIECEKSNKCEKIILVESSYNVKYFELLVR